MDLPGIVLYLGGFLAIWLGAKLVVSSASRFSRDLKLPPFFISFFVLGLLTSIPEFALGITAVVHHDQEIFVGNLIGATAVIFLMIIPLLAILGNGIRLSHNLEASHLIYALIVISAPSFFIIDKRVTTIEGIALIGLYLILVFVIRGSHPLKKSHTGPKPHAFLDLAKLLVGMLIVFAASQIIIDQTLLLSTLLRLSPFVISLIVLSLGTNLPEISLAIGSIFNRQKDIAFGDYMGSAAANTLFFGLFTLLSGSEVLTTTGFIFTFILIAFSLGLFYRFAKSQQTISRREGLILLGIYLVFVSSQIFHLS